MQPAYATKCTASANHNFKPINSGVQQMWLAVSCYLACKLPQRLPNENTINQRVVHLRIDNP